jgi:hypothetical protein
MNTAPSTSAGPSKRLNPQFILFAVALTLSLQGTVLLVKRARFEYDTSGQCLLDNHYTETTSKSGTSSTLSYRVGYKFVVNGNSYSGTDTIYQRPTNAVATVYFTAADPRDNRL